MRSALGLAVVALAIFAACAVPNLDEPAPLPTNNAPAARAPGKSSSPGASPSGSATGNVAPSPIVSDAGATSGRTEQRWTGTLPATTPVQFGGGQSCVYRITLQQVKVDIVAAVNGDIVAANVTAIAFEETLGASCNTPIPVHTHTYKLATATVLPSGIGHLELFPLAANHPAASLVIEGDFRTASPQLSFAWHRTDYGPPLDWRVSARISATAQ